MALTSRAPIIRYLEACKEHKSTGGRESKRAVRQYRREACQQMAEYVRKDIYDLTGVYIPYRVTIGKIFGVLTVSERDCIRQIYEKDYARELIAEELRLLPYLGARSGLEYVRRVDIDSDRFERQLTAFAAVPLPHQPHADYSYYAWNAIGACTGKSICISGKISSLDDLVTTLGHEAGHAFNNWPTHLSEEAQCIEETFCDVLSESYKTYFKKRHAGKYAKELKKTTPETMQPLIASVEDLLAKGKIDEAEGKMKGHSADCNTAYLLHCKRYSGDEYVLAATQSLFARYGARSIRLMNSVPTKVLLAQLCERAKERTFEELLDER